MIRSLRLSLLLLLLVPAARAQSGRPVSPREPQAPAVATGPVIEVAPPDFRAQPHLRLGAQDWAARLVGTAPYDASLGKSSGVMSKLDARARLLLASQAGMGKNAGALLEALPDVAVSTRGGDVMVDVMAELAPGASVAAIEALGAEVQARVGSIVALRVPLSALQAVAARAEVERVETSLRRPSTMFASRAEIRADLVHNGVGLPGPVRGEGVVVGVLDSGLDVAHPDFFNEGGSRVQFLLEYLKNGGQAEWTKAQIDANPTAVAERDGDGGHGHGTHVTGTAAGGGRVEASMRGIAPRADIIFVKGVRDPDSNGGFSDNDVVAGVQYIFNKAAALGKPVVVNLSLGSSGGPLDGSTMQERALSDLVGPGRIIVVAAGNSGFDLIHAGGNTVANGISQAMLLPSGRGAALADIWYEQGAVAEVGLAAYYLDASNNVTLANFSGWMPVGNAFSDWQQFTVDGQPIAEFAMDASTTRDPVNGDGNAVVLVRGNEQLDPSQFLWAVVMRGSRADRVDLWAQGGEFLAGRLGFQGINELPGNTDFTVGSPSTAERVISVASYVTTNTWVDLDGNRYEARSPSPNRDGTSFQPVLGQLSYFSSIGPSRNGKQKPQIAAPGELIFSTLSSHLTVGKGVERAKILAGGRYQGMQGTSMASPHITGVVALMLQVNPSLTFETALDILTTTVRKDGQMGTTPNFGWGAGRVDALAAVQEALRRAGGTGPGGGITRATLARFDPAGQQRNFSVDGVLPVDSGFVAGMNIFGDRAKATGFDLPTGATSAEVTGVDVWFGYKKPALARKYALEIYATTGGAPSGTPLFRQEYDFSHALADADLGTPESPTTHPFTAPVRVNGPFVVSIDFGAYTPAEAGALSIVTTGLAGAPVPHVWERWSDGTWSRLGDSWNFGSGAGKDGLNLWITAGVQYTTSTPVEDGEHPAALALQMSGPNPFRESTTLGYSLPQAGHVTLSVYDLLGRRVATLVDGLQPAGSYTVPFSPSMLASGLYLARLEAAGETRVQRLVRAN